MSKIIESKINNVYCGIKREYENPFYFTPSQDEITKNSFGLLRLRLRKQELILGPPFSARETLNLFRFATSTSNNG